jgi:hypothetical protein
MGELSEVLERQDKLPEALQACEQSIQWLTDENLAA